MPSKKTWAEKWGESTPDYTMGKKAMAKTLQKVRQSTTRRVASLTSKKAFSYAAHQFNQSIKKTYLSGKLPKIENMSYKQMERELRYHHQFWSSKTSTERGSRAEQIEQSKRIFGTKKGGQPIRIMTFDESKLYWAVHDEFYNMYADSTARFDSSRVQQAVGVAMQMGNGFIDKDVDIVQILQGAREALESQSELEEQGYEFQGFDPSHPNKQWTPGLPTLKSWKKMVKEVYHGNGDALK